MISPEQRAEIRRLFYAEHWKVGTIASALGVHPDTVKNAIEADRFLSGCAARPRASMLDPFMPLIRETLEQYPRLRATRLYEMLQDRGYKGSVVHLRRIVKEIRPAAGGAAYLKMRVLPGEQAQVDWGSFGIFQGRRLSCFVMVLSWSRAIHARFSLDQSMESFLRGHVDAFGYFQAVPRMVLYDNLKSAVLERRGQAIHFHPRLLELCGHYHFAPRPVNPARGNEKGRVERQIRYLRTSFFAAREFRDVEDLNQQFRDWREKVAHPRPQPEHRRERTVAEALEHERPYLLSLPQHPFETDLVKPIRSGKTPYVRFDRNQYSIPYKLVRKSLTLVAGHDQVRLLDGQQVVAQHVRSWELGQVVEDPAHIEELVQAKANARQSKGRDRLHDAAPGTQQLFEMLALRGENLGSHTARLLRLLNEYGAQEFKTAIQLAIEKEAWGSGSVAHILEQRRRKKGLSPPIPVHLPNNPRVRDIHVTPHNLEEYDELGKDDDEEDSQ